MTMINEKYEQLLEVLATKLGTTVEHLWDVLIKQATISGLTDLVICSILVLAAWWVVVFVKQKTTPREGLNKLLIPADWHGDEVPAWGVAMLIVMIVSIIVLFTLPGIVYAFTNPEYWALKQLLGML